MAISLETAKNAIKSLFWVAWQADTPAIAGSVPHVEWDNLETVDAPADVDEPFARVFVRHQGGGQSTMGEAGNRRFERNGTVYVQIFVPQRLGTQLADRLAQVAIDAYEGEHAQVDVGECIWFQDVAANEVGQDPDGLARYMVMVTARFSYDEVK